MLKRTRSKSETSSGHRSRKVSTTVMNHRHTYADDRKHTCTFTTEARQILNELRKNNLLCDAKISIKDDVTSEYFDYPIHRFVLAVSSSYLRTAFANMKSNENPSLELNIRCNALESLLDYAYTRQCRLTLDNVNEIINAAELCQMTSLYQYCCEYLINNINDENIFNVFNFAKIRSNLPLFNTAYEYLTRNFIRITKTNNHYHKMSLEQLIQFVGNNDLNIRNEDDLFDVCIQWIDYDIEKRKPFLLRLIENVRLGLIPMQLFISKIKQHSYVKDNDECKPLIGKTLRMIYKLDDDGLATTELDCSLIRPRHAHTMILAFGGWSGGNATSILEAYDIRMDKWTIISLDQAPPRAYHGCITINDRMYVIGGFDGTEYFNSCRVYHLTDRMWMDIAPMNERRCYVSVAYLNGLLYAMGGFNGHIRQNTAEKYAFDTNQWSAICPMYMQRSDASACTLNDLVYICGGFDGQECLQSAEYYNPVTNQWTMIQPMRTRRSGVGVIANHGFVYAIGGFNGTTRLGTGERYNPALNTWRPMTAMFHPRSNFAIEVLDDLLFTIGGFNGITTASNVECYDSKTDEWYDVADMNLFRSAVSACVVDGLKFTRSFLYANEPMVSPDQSASTKARSSVITTSLNAHLRHFPHNHVS